MISSLRGKVQEIDVNTITLDVNGVGYEILCSGETVSNLDAKKEVTVIIYTDVREDAINLYGFSDKLEKRVFLLLTKVKGLGAKSASEVISKINKIELLRIIGNENVQALQQIKGIGKKTAERIVLELKDQVTQFANLHYDGLAIEKSIIPDRQEAVSALVALGFARKDAEVAVSNVKNSSKLDTGEIVKEALKYV